MSRFLRNVLAVAYREAIVLRHDRAFIAVVTMQPVMMLCLFGFVLSNRPANVPWAVLDRSQTVTSRRFIDDVRATGYFLAPRRVAGYGEGRELLHGGRALALLVLPEDFAVDVERGRGTVQLLLDGSDPLSSARIGAYVAEVASTFAAADGARRASGPVRRPGAVDVRQRFRFNPTLRDRNFFLAAFAGMLLTNICYSATALGLVGERETGTFEQMLSLPTSTLEIVLGKLVPYVGVCYAVATFAVGASGVVFGLWPHGSVLALVGITLPFVLTSLAVGVLISALARSSAQAVFISVFFILPSFVLSGAMFPYQLMPPAVRMLGGIFPLRWYQIALRRIVERGGGFADVVGPFAVLGVLFALLLLLIRWRMRPRLG